MPVRVLIAGALIAMIAMAAPASADTVTMTSLDGATPDGRGQWHVQAGRLAGGDPAVVDTFNAASQASAHRVIDAVRADADAERDVRWEFNSKTHVTFRSIAVAQVISGTWTADLLARAVRYVGTVVIDSRTAQPIEVVDLFTDPAEGINRLSEQTKTLTGYDGIPATAASFANWIPTDAGVELHFPSSLLFWPESITVPWPVLADALAPEMAGLAHA